MFQQSLKRCPRCNHEYNLDDKYCGNCGVPVTKAEDNQETVGVLQAHGMGGMLAVSSPGAASLIKHNNLRRILFFLMLSFIIVSAFVVGIYVGRRTVVIPSATQAALPKTNIYTLPVFYSQGFPGMNTHINLTLGEQLIITAGGSASTCPSCFPVYPDGASGSTSVSSVYPPARIGTLLGSIGQVGTNASTSWFVIGNYYSSRVSVSGQLFLIINDDRYNDNSGNYQVTIMVEKS